MIVLDLEFNSGLYEPENLDEILQIGAVRVDRLGGPVRDVFNAYIKPRVHKRLTPGARVLPELEESLKRGRPFEEVYRAWLTFIAGETEFAEWGRDDFKILCRNALHYGLEPVFPEKYTDIQSAFSRALGGVNSAQLYQAAEYCRVPDTFVFHNALHDALYTGLIGGFLPEDALAACTFPLTRENVLSQPHPLRKRKGTVRMGAVDCPDHGPVLRRLKLMSDDTGAFWTYNETLPATDKNLRALAKASAGETFACSRRKGSRARRRDRHGKRKGKNT